MALFSILIDIAAKTAGFEEGIKRVENKLEHFGEVAKRVGETALGFVGIGLGFHELANSIEEAVQRGAKLDILANRMGTTTESLSQLEFAAKMSNVQFESLTQGIDMMSKNLGMASEDLGRAKRALADLGIDAEKLVKLPLDEQLSLLADKISAVRNPTDQTRIAMQIFGGAVGAQLLPVLRKGSEGLAEFRAESDKVGNTLSTMSAVELHQAEEAIKRLSSAWTGFTAKLATGFALTAKDLHLIPPTALEELDAQMKKLVEQRNFLLSVNNKMDDGWLSRFLLGKNFDKEKDSLLQQLAFVEKEMNDVNDKLKDLGSPKHQPDDPTIQKPEDAPIGRHFINPQRKQELEDNMKWLEDQKQLHDEELRLTQTAVDAEVAAYREKISAVDDLEQQGLVTAEEASKRRNEIIDNEFVEFTVTQKKMVEKVEKSRFDMSEIMRRGAQNMQQGLSDFFFDPAAKGFDGLVKGFADTIRRMLADAAAANIFEKLFGSGQFKSGNDNGWLGNALSGLFSSGSGGGSDSGGNSLLGAFGGGKATGGPLDQGKWYIAGERGPEPIWGGGAGAYAMGYGGGSGGGNITINMPVDARGATQDAIKLLPAVHDSAVRNAVAQVIDMKRRGKI